MAPALPHLCCEAPALVNQSQTQRSRNATGQWEERATGQLRSVELLLRNHDGEVRRGWCCRRDATQDDGSSSSLVGTVSRNRTR